MNIVRADFIFGILMLLSGSCILLKIFFNIDIPIFKLFFAVLLIGAGVSLLLGRCRCTLSWKSEKHSHSEYEDDDT